MLKRTASLLLALLLLSAPIAAEDRQSVVVFAGSASQPPLEEAARMFEAKTGTPVILHLGGSGAMLSQVRLTGVGDLYIPGSPDYLDKARQLALIESEAVILAYLVPAVLVAKGNPHQIDELADLAAPGLRVGLADPDGVCVGLYAVELLAFNKLLEQVKPNLRGYVESCAKTAAMIPLGTVDAVLGWREFADWNSQAMDAVLLRPDQVPRLAYIPAAQLTHARNPMGAGAFLSFLSSAQGKDIFNKWGYYTEEQAIRALAPDARIGGTYTLPGGW